MTPANQRSGGSVQPVDGSYLYKVGAALRPLENLHADTPWKEAWLPLYIAASELETFINQSVYAVAVRNSRENANALLTILKRQSEEAPKQENAEKPIGAWNAYQLSNALKEFQV